MPLYNKSHKSVLKLNWAVFFNRHSLKAYHAWEIILIRLRQSKANEIVLPPQKHMNYWGVKMEKFQIIFYDLIWIKNARRRRAEESSIIEREKSSQIKTSDSYKAETDRWNPLENIQAPAF